MLFRCKQFTMMAFTFLLLAGCASSIDSLGTINGEPLSLSEFERMYAENNGGWEEARKADVRSLEKFFDLYVKFKLKLLEAKNQGLLQDSSVQDELEEYRRSLSTSYTVEKELVEPRLREFNRRQQEEIRASHILIRVAPTASPSDTLAAYQKAMGIIRMASRTAQFDSLARSFSQDPSAANNSGDLGWFSHGRMVREFEDAAYSLRPGQISSIPIRTQFGYHIMKVVARKPNEGSISVSHILKRFSQDGADSNAVRDSVEAIVQKIRSEEISFEQAAYMYSDDPANKKRGGALGIYQHSTLPEQISEILFNTPVGSMPAPYRATYGYHIFKITGKNGPPTYEEAEKDLRQQYQQQYYASDYNDYLNKLKERYHLNFDVRLRYDLSHSFDTTRTSLMPGWSDTLNPSLFPKALFMYDSTTFTVGDFILNMKNSQEFGTYRLTPENIETIIDRVADATILDHHGAAAAERFPAFRKLMDDYVNGTLIYRIEQDEVWNKIPVNDSLLHNFYEKHIAAYQWPLRINVAEIFVSSKQFADSLHQRIMRGENFDTLAATYTQRPGFQQKHGVWGFLRFDTNELTARGFKVKKDSVSVPFKYESGWSIIKNLGTEKVRSKTFEEALPEVAGHYRDNAAKEREEAWIRSLKEKYRITLTKETLSKAFKEHSVE